MDPKTHMQQPSAAPVEAASETPAEPVAWRYVPSEVWGDAVLTQDAKTVNLAREMGREVEPLYTAAAIAAARAEGYAAGMDRAAEVCDTLKMGRPGHSAAHDVVLYRGDCADAIRAAKVESAPPAAKPGE